MDGFDIDKVIRLNLERILKERKLTRKKFAKIIKKPASQVSNWLSDPEKTDSAKPLGKKLIEEICEKADINIAEFYNFSVVGHYDKNSSQKNIDNIKTERDLYRELVEERKKIIKMLERENQDLKDQVKQITARSPDSCCISLADMNKHKRRDDPDDFDPSGVRKHVHELFKK